VPANVFVEIRELASDYVKRDLPPAALRPKHRPVPAA
jgi:hypothetical protein